MADEELQVVKVQIALDRDRPGRGLIYGKGRLHMTEQELPPHVIKQMSFYVKAFFMARWVPDPASGGAVGVWSLGDNTSDPGW